MSATNITEDVYLTLKKAAFYLSISPRTLSRRHAEGSGPPRIKHGQIIYYRQSKLDEWLISLERECVRSPL